MLLARTKRYISLRQQGEPVALFSEAAVRKLRVLNRISMVFVTGSLAALAVSSLFVSALGRSSAGSEEEGLVMIGVVVLTYSVSHLIRHVVRR